MKKKSTEQFIKEAKEVYGEKYDYSLVEYISYHSKVKIICPEHGEFEITPADLLANHGCKKCGYVKNTKKRTPSTEEFVAKAKNIHGDRYDYSSSDYVNSYTKVKIICLKHGDFWQSPNSHLKGRGCPVCGLSENKTKRTKSTEQFVKEAKEIHGDRYDYSLANYKNSKSKVKIICPEHGEFEQTPNLHLRGRGCPNCFVKSKGEELVAKILEDNGFVLNETYYREYRFDDCRDKNPLPFDFFVPEKNLLIEFNGKQHYEKSNGFKDTDKSFLTRKHHDWLKRKYAKDNNYDLLVIPYWKYYELLGFKLN